MPPDQLEVLPTIDIDPCDIERVIPAGPGRAVLDLFPGSGPVEIGTLIRDLHDLYRVDMVLVRETVSSGARVLATVVPQQAEYHSDDPNT